MARPRTPVGAYGAIAVRRRGDRVIAETRIRDADGRIRHVRVSARTAAQAQLVLKERLLDRPALGRTHKYTISQVVRSHDGANTRCQEQDP